MPCAPVALVWAYLAEAFPFPTPVLPFSPGLQKERALGRLSPVSGQEVLAPSRTSQPGLGGLLCLSLRQPPWLPFSRDRCAPL